MTFPAIAYKMKTSRPRASTTLISAKATLTEQSRSQRVLSLDGGGIRGVLSVTILAALEEQLIEQTGNPETRLIDYFDYVAGTSTGGILACLYLLPEDVQMNIVSLGTGDTSQSFEIEDLKSKGMRNSWKPLLNIISSASGQTVDQQLKELLNTSNKGNYYRLNPALQHLNTSMDDVSDKQLDGLMALGETFFAKESTVISQLLSELTKR